MDVTGKSGIGKRVLDANGNRRAVTSLPKEVQAEIKASQKVAASQMKEKALRHNKDYQDLKAKESEAALKVENAELRDVVKQQGTLLAQINAKLELGATPTVEVKPEVVTPKVVAPQEPSALQAGYKKSKLKGKAVLQAEATELGLKFSKQRTTVVELTKMIEEAEDAKTDAAIADL